MNEMSETLGSVLTGCAYFINLLYLVAAVVAFVRLKATAAGLLTGGALAAMSVCGLGMKAYRSFVLQPHLTGEAIYDPTVDLDSVMMQMQAASFTSTCVSMLCWLAIAIGISMIPKAFPPPPEGSGA